MKVSEIHVDSFGHWSGLRVPEISSGVTVIHGPNEAGKSTLLQLMRAILYGFSPRRHERFVPPRFEGRVGGTLLVDGTMGRFRISRHLPASKRLADHEKSELSVSSVDGGLQGRHILGSLLSGVDEQVFSNVFAVGLGEIQHLGTLSDTDAARQLYGLASGGERVSIADVSQHLDAVRQSLLACDKGVSLTSLIARRDALKAEIEGESGHTERWLALQRERDNLTKEIDELQRRQEQFGDPLVSTDVTRELLDRWAECLGLHREIESLGQIRAIPEETLRQLQTIRGEVVDVRKKWEAVREQRRGLRDQGSELKANPLLLRRQTEIQDLHRRRTHWVELVENADRLGTQVEEAEFELQSELERLGIKANWKFESLPVITDEMVDQLRGLSREARDAKKSLDESTAREQEARAICDRTREKLASALGHLGHSTLHPDVEQLEERSGLLRRRIDLDSRLAKQQRNLKEARKESHHWITRQVMPWRGLMLLGSIFTLGMILLLFGIFGQHFEIDIDRRWAMGMIGGIISFAAVLVKHLAEFAASRSIASCREEIDRSRKQIEAARTEIQTIDEQLPQSTEPWSVQLKKNEQELSQLSQFLPLQTELDEAQKAAADAKVDLAAANERLTRSRRNWRDSLRHFGMPEALTPQQFSQLAQPEGNMARIRDQLLALRRQREDQARELEHVSRQVQSLMENCEVVAESDLVYEQIEQLARRLKAEQKVSQQRQSLFDQWKQHSRDLTTLSKNGQRLQEKCRRLMEKCGVEDSRQLKEVVRRQERVATLRAQLRQSLKTLAERLGGEFSAKQLAKSLEVDDFEKRLTKLQRDQQTVASRLSSLLEQRGELNQQIKSRTDHRVAAERRQTLGEVEQQIADIWASWTELAGVTLAIDAVRGAYESDRQPETLAEASSYLKRLTDGRYQRIWTPFGESALRVDEQNGRAVRVENLSRGTREQVYLSLRLALASSYARRGVGLPLILDDVFVNFDAKRARLAAETVCQFASAGHQVLIFTCHDHICDVFRSMQIDVRTLPTPEDVAEHGAAVLPHSAPPETPKETTPVVPVAEPSVWVDEDPELDHELMYGAPEYDPGYEPEEEALAAG